jgi:transposase-like protein
VFFALSDLEAVVLEYGLANDKGKAHNRRTTMDKDSSKQLGKVIKIDEAEVQKHVDEIVRGTVEETLNALLEEEADRLCNARRYERTPDRLDTRAGHYERGLQTKAGEVSLKVPKLRTLTFETAIIERYRRRESSVEEALMEMYLAGVSVRRVEDITEALWGTRVKASTVSDLNQKLYERIEAWRQKPIEQAFPYVYLDGIALKRSWGGEVRQVAVLVAIGVGEDGYRDILGVAEGAKEDKASWTTFLRYLKQRGLRGVKLFTTDKCLGLVESLGEFYPEALWQRCMVHFYRNVFSVVPKGKVKEVSAMLKAIHAQEDRQEALKKAESVRQKLEQIEAAQGRRARLRRHPGDAELLLLSAGALASDSHEQSAGADQPRNPPTDQGGRLLS